MNWIQKLIWGPDYASMGEPGWKFDPHWPGPFIGDAGAWTNYVMAIAAVVLLVLFFRRSHKARLERLRTWAAGACAAGVAIAIPLVAGASWWSVALAVIVLALLIAFMTRGRREGVLVLGRVALMAFLLMVISGTLAWNLALAAGGAWLVIGVYRRDGRSRFGRLFLGTLRAALVAFVILILNNPILTRTSTLVEPSVVAVLVDDSMSMKVRDVHPTPAAQGPSRLQAAVDLLTGDDQALIRRLAKTHSLHFYSFDQNAHQLGAVAGDDETGKPRSNAPATQPAAGSALIRALSNLKASGVSTQVISSILTVLDELQGQRLAGIVVITDGRDTPTAPLADAYKTLADYGVKVYPVSVGSDQAPRNIEVQSLSMEDSAFNGDIVNVKVTVRATGYEPGHSVKLKLIDKKTGALLRDPDGRLAEKTVNLPDDKPFEQEMLFKPEQVGPLDVKAEAEPQPGEIDDTDNFRTAPLSVLDAKITVLYVEGYPRWEYRYIKNEMIRDKTVNISCLLLSADPTFAQEHSDLKAKGESEAYRYFPFSQFPTSLEQLMECDVVLFGDVDPRQLADAQLQMIADFVGKKGGGFGMIAGPQWSPAAYRNTPIEAILPVNILRTEAGWPSDTMTEGFRPMLTKEGQNSSIFRFFTDKAQNDSYLKNQLQPLFWYCRGVTAKAGADVYAEHPTDLAPDGRKAPLLVLGRYGPGRTLFSAYDDSWRWRFYTGESVFDTYWIQQLRYLARSKKLGQHQMTFTADRPTYTYGDQVKLRLRVLDPAKVGQLPPEISVQMRDDKGQVVGLVRLQKETGQPDLYTASLNADRLGEYTLTLPSDMEGASRYDVRINVIYPRLELANPRMDRTLLSRVANETAGQAVTLADARARLPELIQSAARTILLPHRVSVWDKPPLLAIVIAIFMLLLTTEWVIRKVYGLV